MSKLALGLPLVLAAVFALPAPSSAKSAAKEQAVARADRADKTSTAPLDKEAQQRLREHVKMRNHITKSVKYPATKEEIVTVFKGLHDMKADDRKWFEETLPSKTYASPEEVMKGLGWEVAPEETATPTASGKPAK
jgi:hypothetical protein